MEFSTNPLSDDFTGPVVVYFRGLHNDTVNTKSTQCDVIIERIRAKFHSLSSTDIKDRCKSPRHGNSGRPEGTPRWAEFVESPEGQSLRS